MPAISRLKSLWSPAKRTKSLKIQNDKKRDQSDCDRVRRFCRHDGGDGMGGRLLERAMANQVKVIRPQRDTL